MRKITAFLVTLICAGAIASAAGAVFASAYNYSKLKVIVPKMIFYGYVQVKPSYNDGGSHAVFGWMQFFSTFGNSAKYYTGSGQGPDDSKVYSNEGTYEVSLRRLSEGHHFIEMTEGYRYVNIKGAWPFDSTVSE